MQLDYENLNTLLFRARSFVDASRCHGFLCGQLCICDNPDQQLWQEFLDVQENDNHVVSECYDEIFRLINIISKDIRSEDYTFQPLLPANDEALTDRVEGLAAWCDGFLTGFALRDERSDNVVLTENCDEILQDFSSIAQVFIEEEEAESGERALFELVEYVRMSTIILYEELRPVTMSESDPRILH